MEEDNGVSLGEIFKVIFKKVWWVVAVTAAVMIIFVCLIQFWFNPSKQMYSASFDIRLPSGNVYPDGTELRLEDSVLLENLQLIKDESLLSESKRTGNFADIDIQKMVEEDDVVLTHMIEQKEDETYEYHNTVRIVKKYFKNKKQAAAFVKAVAEFSVDNAKNIVNNMNYSELLAKYQRYNTYEEKINALIAQKNYIESMYEKISDKYSGEYVPSGLNSGKSIDDYIRDLTDVFDTREQEAVRNTVSANYYVWDTATYLDNAQAKIKALEVEIEENKNRIDAQIAERDKLKENFGSIQETTEFDKIIADLADRSAVMQNEIDKTNETLRRIDVYIDGDGKAAKEAFDKRLDKICAQLEEATQVLKTVNIATYEEKAQAIYVNNKVEIKGGLNIILAAAIGVVAGFVIVSAVILIIDLPKYKREKLSAETVTAEEQENPDGEEKA